MLARWTRGGTSTAELPCIKTRGDLHRAHLHLASNESSWPDTTVLTLKYQFCIYTIGSPMIVEIDRSCAGAQKRGCCEGSYPDRARDSRCVTVQLVSGPCLLELLWVHESEYTCCCGTVSRSVSRMCVLAYVFATRHGSVWYVQHRGCTPFALRPLRATLPHAPIVVVDRVRRCSSSRCCCCCCCCCCCSGRYLTHHTRH